MLSGVGKTFRDPQGSCYELNGRILRSVYPEFGDHALSLLKDPFIQQLIKSGSFPPTRVLSPEESSSLPGAGTEGVAGGLILEHDAIFFPSYPQEWSPGMLYQAGELTLKLQLDGFAAGLTLKDATPTNVLFRGTQPVFVDFLSFSKRRHGSVLWPAYAQFIRTFLLPLLLNARTKSPLAEVFLTHRDGLEPEEVFRRFSWIRRLFPQVFSHVTLPTWLGKKDSAHHLEVETADNPADDERSKFIAENLVKRLQSSFRKLKSKAQADSNWSSYMESHSYVPESFKAKEAFVKGALEEVKPKTVLDIGCNTGYWSQLAARLGSSVVALDYDPEVIDLLYESAVAEKLDILPLVVNFSRPTPSVGWRNSEQKSFLDRAKGKFDCVVMLAVIHHLTVTDAIPLEDVFEAVSQITKRDLIIEYVPPEDPMFKVIARNKKHLVERLSQPNFERSFAPYFGLVRKAPLPGNPRTLYLLRRLV